MDPRFVFSDRVSGGAIHHEQGQRGEKQHLFCLQNNSKGNQCLPDCNLG